MMKTKICGTLIPFIVLINVLPADLLCQHLLPGLSNVLRGIDVTELEFLPHELYEADGFRLPVLAFTCDQGKKKNFQGKSYDEPDQIWTISHYSRGNTENTAILYKSSSDILKKTAALMDIDLFDGAFRASSNYIYYQRVIDQNFYYVEEINSTVLLFQMQMKPSENLALDAHFQNAIESLPSDLNNGIKDYQKVVNVFGTHYFNKATFGGIVIMRLETSQDYHKKHSDEKIIAEAESSFASFLKAQGDISHNTASVSEEFRKASKESIRFYGGNGVNTLQKWQEELKKSPWLLNGKVSPYWNLITNETIRENMKSVITFRKNRVLLGDLKRILQQQYSYLFSQFQSKIDNLLSESYFNHSSVEKIKQDITTAIAEDSTTPSWFKNMELCYKQTSESSSAEKCITSGEQMELVCDSKDSCTIQWKVNLESSAVWLENFKMCVDWCLNCESNSNSYARIWIGDAIIKCQFNNNCQTEANIPNNVPSWVGKSERKFSLSLKSSLRMHAIHCEWTNKYNKIKILRVHNTNYICSGGCSLNFLSALVVVLTYTLSFWL